MPLSVIFQLIFVSITATAVLVWSGIACHSKKCLAHKQDHPSKQNRQSGFTLIELMITLVIASLMLTIGVPSLSNMLQNNRLSSQTNQFIAAINFARSEAIKRGANIDVKATDSSNADNEWGNGWSIEQGATVLRIFQTLDGSSTLNSNTSKTQFQYNSRGRVNGTDTLELCDSRSGEIGRRITISPTGRVSSAQFTCS